MGARGQGLARAIAASALVMAIAVSSAATKAAALEARTVAGTVVGGDVPLASLAVALYRTTAGSAVQIGDAVTDRAGRFSIRYTPPAERDVVLYLFARRGPLAMATTLGSLSMPTRAVEPDGIAAKSGAEPAAADLATNVVINERTTVAMAYALAQFLDGSNVKGNRVGVRNAAAMVGDMVDVVERRDRAGARPIAERLRRPRRWRPSTRWPTWSPAAPRTPTAAPDLLRLAPRSPGVSPNQTLQAIVDIARNPWRNVGKLFTVAAASLGLLRRR